MAYEKISEKHLREEKVKKVKEKILAEIEEWLDDAKQLIKLFLENNDEEEFNFWIARTFNLARLKEYIQMENCFLGYHAMYNDADTIVYTIPDKNLDIWLQDDYNFTSSFLHRADHTDVFDLLNDKYFAYNHTSIIEEIVYDKKQQEKENN